MQWTLFSCSVFVHVLCANVTDPGLVEVDRNGALLHFTPVSSSSHWLLPSFPNDTPLAVGPMIDDSVGIISSSELRIDPSSQPLGSGTFATCFPALKGATLKCAVKVYKYMDYDQFDRELAAMLRCNRHKNAGVVELSWICTPPSETMGLPRFVMPLVEESLWANGCPSTAGVQRQPPSELCCNWQRLFDIFTIR